MAPRSIPGWLRPFLRLPAAAEDADAALLERFVADGDEEAFAGLLDRHGPLVWGVCRRILRNEHDAEDVFQATFLLLASRAEAVRRPGSVAAWLHGVACRLAVRLKSRRLSTGPVDQAVTSDPAAAADWGEMLALLDEELQRLPECYRQPLVLCYLEGATRDEAARQLGWSLATVRRRVDRGRELLRARLMRRGVTLPTALAGILLTEAVALPAALATAASAAALHWIAGPAEHGLITPSVLSLARQGVSAMGYASFRTLLLLGAGMLALGGGFWVYFAARQSGEVPPQGPTVQVAADPGAAALAATAREAEQALAACESPGFLLLCELAALQARRGDEVAARRLFDEAARSAGGPAPSRAGSLFRLAYFLADAGDLPAARAALAEGHRLVGEIRPDNQRHDLLRLAATCTAEKIDLAQGLADAESLPESVRFSALGLIAVRQAEVGDIAGAQRTLKRLPGFTPGSKPDPWEAIAAAQLQTGDRDAARQTLRQALAAVDQMREKKIGNWQVCRVKVLGGFAVAQYRAGDAEGSRQTLVQTEKAVDEGGPRHLGCLAELARAQAETGQRQAALRTLARFRKAAEPYEDDEASWADILPAQQALGDREGLAGTLRRVSDPRTWKEACAALARAGQEEDARTLARTAPSPQRKAWALVGVLGGQLERIPAGRRPRYDGSLTVTVPDTAPPVPSNKSSDPMAEYYQMVWAYEKSWEAFRQLLDRARDPEGRRRLLEEKRPREEEASVPLLRLAQRHPGERVGFEALAWIIEFARNTAEAETALSLLRQGHLTAKKLGVVCSFARFSRHRAAAEQLLLAALEKSPHRFVRGQACLALADFLQDRAELIVALRRIETPESARNYEEMLGAAEVRRLRAMDSATVLREAEVYYQRVLDEFADLQPPRARSPLAERARSALDRIHLLAVGQVAPDIEGEDINGKPLRLSDQRGKVVVLVFWATWCSACRAMIPDEKALVQRLEGRPFVLLGVNNDPDRTRLREWLAGNPLPWRSWWDGRADGEKGSGRIARAWNVNGWPTIYVLDPRGIIRDRNITGKELDRVVDALLKEAATPR